MDDLRGHRSGNWWLRRIPDAGLFEARVGRLNRHGEVTWSSERIQITGAISRVGSDVVFHID